jgi:hypothetical protein
MNFTVFSTTLHDLAYRVSDSKWQYVVGSWKTWRASQARLVLFGRAGSFSAATATARVALLRTCVQFRQKMIQKLCVLNWSFSQRTSKVEMVKIQNPDFPYYIDLKYTLRKCFEYKIFCLIWLTNEVRNFLDSTCHFQFCLSPTYNIVCIKF